MVARKPMALTLLFSTQDSGVLKSDYLKPPGVVSEEQAKANDERVVREILNHRGPSNLVMITHDLNIADQILKAVGFPHLGSPRSIRLQRIRG